MKSRAPSSAVSSEGAQGGAQREEGVWGSPARRDRQEGLPQHSRGPLAAPFTADSGRQGLRGSPRARCLEGPAPRDPQAGLCLAHAPANSTGSRAGPGCPSQHLPDTPRRARTHHTRAHRTPRALGHVTGRIARGHHHNWTRDFRRRRLLPLALRLRRSAQGLGLGPPADALCRGSFLQGGTRVPGAGSVASTGACDSAEETVLRKAELCLKSEPTGNALQA